MTNSTLDKYQGLSHFQPTLSHPPWPMDSGPSSQAWGVCEEPQPPGTAGPPPYLTSGCWEPLPESTALLCDTRSLFPPCSVLMSTKPALTLGSHLSPGLLPVGAAGVKVLILPGMGVGGRMAGCDHSSSPTHCSPLGCSPSCPALLYPVLGTFRPPELHSHNRAQDSTSLSWPQTFKKAAWVLGWGGGVFTFPGSRGSPLWISQDSPLENGLKL